MIGKNKSKIIALTNEFYPFKGGIAVYVEEVAACASKRGHEFEVWTPMKKSMDYTFDFQVRDLPQPWLGTQSWPSRIRLAKYLAANKKFWKEATIYLPDPGPIRAWMYLQKLGFPKPKQLVITLHGSEILDCTEYPHRKRLFGQLLKTADKIGVVSRYNKKLLMRRYPELEYKIVVTSGALRRMYRVHDSKKHAQDDSIVILTVGRVSPRKGQLPFIEALGGLNESMKSKIIYKMAGPTISNRYLKKIHKAAKYNKVNLQYQGEASRDQLKNLYVSSDVFALTSVPYKNSVEGFGLVFLEASAHGLPIIATRTGGIEDAVLDNKTGILLPVQQPDSWALHIERLLTDRSCLAKMGEEGRKWATHFSWEYIVKKLFEE